MRVYVYYDVEMHQPDHMTGGQWSQPAILKAIETVKSECGWNSVQIPSYVHREMFGATLLPHESVVYPSDAQQVIRVKEK